MPSNRDRDSSKRLLKRLDTNDPFMSAGHQILSVRSDKKIPPPWSLNESRIQEILFTSFPKLKINGSKDQKRAGRWARIIQLYFRSGATHGDVAAELNLDYWVVNSLIKRIRRAAAGRRTDNRGLLGARPKGRPLKSRPK